MKRDGTPSVNAIKGITKAILGQTTETCDSDKV